ncbi:Stress-induced-phosphoprotein 1 [Frankliniella fusca]|uniref:Stress-induced-phosphoprotein 1 n=1 Tax=Frankliniella fusca TaxID=407009 RepID=A0AAE1LKC1_9NEOP|nr:Stress-induced-phosphoprotein 1 [Frankliniella fusca]
MDFYMIEKFKCLLKDGHWPVRPEGIVISLDESEDSFDSAAEEEDEEYLNGIFCSHPSHKTHVHANGFPRTQQIVMKEMHERNKYAEQSAKNAAELLQAEEDEKMKVERRKERKKRKKERKKAEKEANHGNKSTEHGDLNNGNLNNIKDGFKNQDKCKKDKNSIPEDEKSDPDNNDDGFLDVNSAFVTKVVKHKLKSNGCNNNIHSKGNSTNMLNSSQFASSTKRVSNGTRIVPIPEKNILLGERLAVAGYQCASKENYEQAIELFTRALRNVPNDHRYWGNRSFCYFQIGSYQQALEDAECAIQLAPNSPKGHYRRAEALAGLKDLVSAEKSFEKVLELDVDCKDAMDELLNIRMLRLTEMGFSRKEAFAALKKHSTLEAAVEVLMSNETLNTDLDEVEDQINLVYHSDEDIAWDNIGDHESTDNDENNSYFQHITQAQNIQYNQHSSLPGQNFEDDIDSLNKISKKQAAMDPSNPNRCVSIWVGNIEDSVSEKTLNDEFSRFGDILSIRMLPSSHCAFINFKDSKAPGPAMAAMQGKELGGTKLIIRYPNKTKEEQHIHQQMLCHQKRWQSVISDNESDSVGAIGGSSQFTIANTKTTLVPTAKGTRIKLKGPVNGDECYYWRTTGCAFGENCRNKHIKENRGVDRKPWHK